MKFNIEAILIKLFRLRSKFKKIIAKLYVRDKKLNLEILLYKGFEFLLKAMYLNFMLKQNAVYILINRYLV